MYRKIDQRDDYPVPDLKSPEEWEAIADLQQEETRAGRLFSRRRGILLTLFSLIAMLLSLFKVNLSGAIEVLAFLALLILVPASCGIWCFYHELEDDMRVNLAKKKVELERLRGK